MYLLYTVHCKTAMYLFCRILCYSKHHFVATNFFQIGWLVGTVIFWSSSVRFEVCKGDGDRSQWLFIVGRKSTKDLAQSIRFYKSVTRRMIHLGWGLSLKVTMGKKQNSFDKGLLGTRGICAAMHRLQAVLKSHWPLIFKNEVKLSQLGIRTATHCMDTCFNFLRAPCPGARNWTIRTWFTFTGFVGFPPELKHPTSSTEIKMASFFACGFLDTKTGKSPSLKDLRRFNHIQIIQ